MEEYIYEDDPKLNIYYELQAFADRTPSFNAKFLDGIEYYLQKFSRISDAQYYVLQKMYDELMEHTEQMES